MPNQKPVDDGCRRCGKNDLLIDFEEVPRICEECRKSMDTGYRPIVRGILMRLEEAFSRFIRKHTRETPEEAFDRILQENLNSGMDEVTAYECAQALTAYKRRFEGEEDERRKDDQGQAR